MPPGLSRWQDDGKARVAPLEVDGIQPGWSREDRALHDMGDPIGSAARIRGSLPDDGTWLLVEPRAVAHLENNVNL
jgi:hypothetical protein